MLRFAITGVTGGAGGTERPEPCLHRGPWRWQDQGKEGEGDGRGWTVHLARCPSVAGLTGGQHRVPADLEGGARLDGRGPDVLEGMSWKPTASV